MVQGETWRVLTTPGREADVVIHVGELESARHDILLASLRSIAWPMVLAFPLLALGSWWAVRGAVLPLRRLGQGRGSPAPGITGTPFGGVGSPRSGAAG
jgi:two-component system sensor histidine kinase QseC